MKIKEKYSQSTSNQFKAVCVLLSSARLCNLRVDPPFVSRLVSTSWFKTFYKKIRK